MEPSLLLFEHALLAPSIFLRSLCCAGVKVFSGEPNPRVFILVMMHK